MLRTKKFGFYPHNVRLVMPHRVFMMDYFDFCKNTYPTLREKYIIHEPLEHFEEEWAIKALKCFGRNAFGVEPDRVQNTTWFAYNGPLLVGVVNIRHQLTNELKERGGNIGIVIDNRLRGYGFGQEVYKEAIKLAFAINVKPYISIDNENEPSKIALKKVLKKASQWDCEETSSCNGRVTFFSIFEKN